MAAEGEAVEKKGGPGQTELHHAVCRGDEMCVQQLLENRASVDAKDGKGRTPLHLAASEISGATKIIELLLEARAMTEAKDFSGFTPVDLARHSTREEAVAVLLSKVAKGDSLAEDFDTKVYVALMSGRNCACDWSKDRTIGDLKQEAQRELGVPIEYLIGFNMEPLNEGKMLEEENIQPGNTLTAVVDENSSKVPETEAMHFLMMQHVVSLLENEITYHGHIRHDAKQCWASFPGKYQTGFQALVAGHHGDSVACVFLCDVESGLGVHVIDPHSEVGKCYCHRIYGERGDAEYKKFGYVIYVQKTLEKCSDLEISTLERKAKAMNAVLVFEDDDGATRDAKEERAKTRFAQERKVAAWGCGWYHSWLQNVHLAVRLHQRLKVVFFAGEVMQGREDMDALATADLWNGVGLGASQKCQVATLEEMRKSTGDPRWDYDAVDVSDFLIEQFKEGDLVEALDTGSNRWREGRVLKFLQSGKAKYDRQIWDIQCNWSGEEFQSEFLRPLAQHTDRLVQAFKDKKMLQFMEELFEVQVSQKQVQRSWSRGRSSVAVKVNIPNIKQAHALRDKVLIGELDLNINKVLMTPWEVAVDKSAFLDFYEKSLFSLTELALHQTKVVQELRDAGEPGVIHLSGPAGAGKTFLAMKLVLDHIRMSSSGKVLYVAPNRSIVFHFVRCLLTSAQADRKDAATYLARLVVLCEPYDKLQMPVIKGNQLLLASVPMDLEPFEKKVIDVSHPVCSSDTDTGIQECLTKYSSRSTMLLSDLSQSSSAAFTRHSVELTEVARSTQRIVAGASNFQLSESRIDSSGTIGPPLKTFLFEVQPEQDMFTEYVRHVIVALTYVMRVFPSINLKNRIAFLVKDNDFLESLSEKLRPQIEHHFAGRFCLVSCEASLGFLPQHMTTRGPADYSQQAQQNIILDTVSNAKGLEYLIVISIGLDAPIQGGDEDRTTRSLFYQSITRAQLVSVIVNAFVPDGWLAFLGCLKFRAETFDKHKAFAETRTDAAAAMLKVRDSRKEVSAALAKTFEEEPASSVIQAPKISAEPEAATKEPAHVEVLPTFVWDTSDNTINTKIVNLKFDPRSFEDKQSGITLRMTKSMYDKFCPRVELLEDWADLRDSHSLLEVMPSTHTVLSPLLRLTPEDVDFPTSIEVEVPTCSGAESAWRSTATGWENVEISLVRGCAILVLRHFCDVVVSGPCAIRAMGFIKLDQPAAKLAVMHVGCERCRSVLNQYRDDDEELRGFSECGPTAKLGTYNPDENLNIKVPGAGCVELEIPMRFHRFPLVTPKLDTPSKMSFSVEIDGVTFDFEELEPKPSQPSTQVVPSTDASQAVESPALPAGQMVPSTVAVFPAPVPAQRSRRHSAPAAQEVDPTSAVSTSAGSTSPILLRSLQVPVQTSQPQGHLLLSGRFKSDRVFTAEQIMGYMRMVGARLAVRGVPTFMVEAKPGQSFAELTRMGLGRAKGMVAFCTAEYGAYTGAGYETFRELEYAHDKELLLIPIRLCEVWPPAPTDNERGTWQNKLVFTNGLVYIDDQRMQNAEGVADQIADSVKHLGIF